MITTFRRFSLVLGILGFLFFGSLFSLTYINPLFIEQTAKDIIRSRLDSAVKEKIDSLSDHALINKAQQLLKKNESEMNKLKQQLADNVPEKIASVMAEMNNLDCECRKNIEERIKSSKTLRIGTLSQMQEQLTSFMQGKYMEIAQHLKREFRIFTGTNSFAFLILIAAIFIKRKAGIHLLIPALLLLLATAIASYFYIFNQNWLEAILFSNYVGFGYVAYIGVIFAFLCDIIFNHARITVEILNGILQAIGSAFSALPC